MSHPPKQGFVNLLQEFSVPLIMGVVAALVYANVSGESWEQYQELIHWLPFGDVAILGHAVDLHFLINDIFMVFFFGIAAKEITEAALPGGSLNPIKKAVNPLFATLGGVLGPVGFFFGALYLAFSAGFFEGLDPAVVRNGWGIPTATDIALAWLVARAVFGAGHPAVNFLLLLAVADDAIGLGIIAVFYGDPANPAEPTWLLLVLAGMGLAFALRKANVRTWLPYILVAGTMAWSGLLLAHLHPALALVFIVPFLPGPKLDAGLFLEEDDGDGQPSHAAVASHSPLENYEHQTKLFVDIGLFFFAFANAGVQFAGIGAMTWIILGSLAIGKTIGITAFALLGRLLGFPLPTGMGLKELLMAGYIAGLGLTVALFVAGAAFTDPELLGQAKMGALFSGFVGLTAILFGRMLGLGRSRA
ncbi:MAG: Na+/H+ antiporter NhaA [Planctomycetota bacterium]